MDEETRRNVKRFHLRVTLIGGCLLVAGSLAAAYILLFQKPGEVPGFMRALARWLAR